MENKKHEWFRLTKSSAQFLLCYLCLLILISSGFLITLLIEEINPFKKLSIFSLSIVAAITTSVLGSSIYYSRKLYKACINLDMLLPNDMNDKIRQLGVISYYLLRPLFSACLSLIACIALRSGTEFITKDGGINQNFPYLIMIVSFFVGYSSSDFIDYLEIKGRKVVQGVFNKEDVK